MREGKVWWVLPASLWAATAGAATPITVCTQNLFNYGSPEQVRKLRHPGMPPERIRAMIAQQEKALVSRLSGCDAVAVQEVLGEDDDEALSALERLGRLLAFSTGHVYGTRVADTSDVIRNGFLFRTDGGLEEVAFDGSHTRDPLPVIPRFGDVHWERGPAELVLGIADRSGPVARSRRTRIRLISAHLRSRREAERSFDPNHEEWERVRVVEAAGLLALARRRLWEDPEALLLVAGDVNNGRGSPTQMTLSGEIDPRKLLSPRDCIDAAARLTCELQRAPASLVSLLDADSDLKGKGSYRFDGREELIDVLLASPRTARLARQPGGREGDYDVALVGRLGQGSDHRMGRVTLHL